MSLDVHLYSKSFRKRTPSSGIFIREDGCNKEISVEEWNRRFPDRQAVIVTPDDEETNEVFSANITHNLTRMADEAGIYEYLWIPEEKGITKAGELVAPLSVGFELLKSDPERFKQLNPENGWGDYTGLLSFVENYLNVCIDYPDAEIRLSR